MAPLFTDFLQRCALIKPNIDIQKLSEITSYTIKHLKASKSARESTKAQQEIEKLWYESIEQGKPDFSLYKRDYYLAELFACYSVYSHQHIVNIQKPFSGIDKSIVELIGEVKGVLDIGCGLGYTTADLKTLWPQARIIGSEPRESSQFLFALDLSSIKDFEITDDFKKIDFQIDVVFASEYFEHFLNPIEHLGEIVAYLRPQFFIIANSFNGKAIGHFNTYSYSEVSIDASQMGRWFNENMRSLGYKKLKTKLWNSRPTIWELQ